MTLGFIGTGHIATALVTGLASSPGWRETIFVSPRNAETASALAARFACVRVARGNQEVVDRSDPVILALRPQAAHAALSALRFRPEQRVVSLIAMLPAAALRRLAAPAARLARALPLLSTARREGPVVVWPGDADVVGLFDRVGAVTVAPSEEAFHVLWAVTALAAPTYGLLERIAGWAAQRGVPAFLGAGYARDFLRSLLATNDLDFAALKASVSTKGGLNEQAVRALEGAGSCEAIVRVLETALARLAGDRPAR